MSPRTRNAIFGGAALATIVVASLLWQKLLNQGPRFVAFPNDGDVASVTASLTNEGYFPAAIPEFEVPPEYVPRLLAAFRPAEECDYPAGWKALGRLTIKTKSGKTHVVTFPDSGKNALCFTFDGVRCTRGGPYEPVDVGARENWISECFAVARIIRELHEEQTGRNRSDSLAKCFEDLERSAGLRAPERP